MLWENQFCVNSRRVLHPCCNHRHPSLPPPRPAPPPCAPLAAPPSSSPATRARLCFKNMQYPDPPSPPCAPPLCCVVAAAEEEMDDFEFRCMIEGLSLAPLQAASDSTTHISICVSPPFADSCKNHPAGTTRHSPDLRRNKRKQHTQNRQ